VNSADSRFLAGESFRSFSANILFASEASAAQARPWVEQRSRTREIFLQQGNSLSWSSMLIEN